MFGHICQASAHRGTADEPVVTGFRTDVPQWGRIAINHKLSLRGLTLMKMELQEEKVTHLPMVANVHCDGNTPIAQGRHELIILSGNTPS